MTALNIGINTPLFTTAVDSYKALAQSEQKRHCIISLKDSGTGALSFKVAKKVSLMVYLIKAVASYLGLVSISAVTTQNTNQETLKSGVSSYLRNIEYFESDTNSDYATIKTDIQNFIAIINCLATTSGIKSDLDSVYKPLHLENQKLESLINLELAAKPIADPVTKAAEPAVRITSENLHTIEFVGENDDWQNSSSF